MTPGSIMRSRADIVRHHDTDDHGFGEIGGRRAAVGPKAIH